MYILENKLDGSIFGAKSYSVKYMFSTPASAKAAMTRYAKKYSDIFDASEYMVSDYDSYVEPQVTKTARIPGTGETKTYTIGINRVGGCTDPGTETYWSMQSATINSCMDFNTVTQFELHLAKWWGSPYAVATDC